MPILHAIVLGIVQGLSEFLPISSSGHLILVPELFQWTELTDHPSLNKTFAVALHVGTFVGAAWYFRHDLIRYIAAAWRSLRRRAIRSVDERMAWLLVLSAIPGAVVGAALEGPIEDHTGQPVLVGVMLIVFGAVLLVADRLPARRHQDDFRLRDALLMGTAQAVALQPGVSRSGITISMGRWLAFDRTAAARLSFLMSLPIIAGAGLYKGVQVARDGGIPDNYVAPFVWGMVAAAISSFLVIGWLLRFLQTRSFAPFVIYRFVVGAAVIVIFATGLR
jgi:undecaprenyl-diphosphatase